MRMIIIHVPPLRAHALYHIQKTLTLVIFAVLGEKGDTCVNCFGEISSIPGPQGPPGQPGFPGKK